jgi:hypothetical protein
MGVGSGSKRLNLVEGGIGGKFSAKVEGGNRWQVFNLVEGGNRSDAVAHSASPCELCCW